MNIRTLSHFLKLVSEHRAILIDVRTMQEFCQGHLAGAFLIPTPPPPLSTREHKTLSSQLQYSLRKVPKNIPILVYCKKGIRAGVAQQILTELGYTAYVLGGVDEEPIRSIMTGNRKVWEVCYCQG